MIDLHKQERICLICGSNETGINKTKYGTPYPLWYYYKDGFLCKKCYCREWRSRNPEKIKGYHEKWDKICTPRILCWTPTDKFLHLQVEPRKGVCQWCGKKIGDEYVDSRGKLAIVKLTNIHHIEYHEDDPLRDTVELCNSCHSKETRRLEKLKKGN